MSNAGTLILSGTNSYSGGTIVDAGTLIVDSPESLLDGSNLSVGAGVRRSWRVRRPRPLRWRSPNRERWRSCWPQFGVRQFIAAFAGRRPLECGTGTIGHSASAVSRK